MTILAQDWPKVPFEIEHELNQGLSSDISSQGTRGKPETKLSGNPRITLGSCSAELTVYLDKEFRTPELDTMAPNLWLMTTQSSAHISTLHHQRVKGREIVITEDPRLHLLWIDDRIFVKPLPPYLLSHGFWTTYLLPHAQTKTPFAAQESILPSVLGFLRTYAHLIHHQSDLDVALKHSLLPPTVTLEAFCAFSSQFTAIPDAAVSPRYSFGEMRLSRLNFWTKFLLPGRWHYMPVYRQYSAYFQRLFAPFLFIFGSVSVILSAIQVEMAVEPLADMPWKGFQGFARYFSVVSLFLTGLASLALLLLFLIKISIEFAYATRTKKKVGK